MSNAQPTNAVVAEHRPPGAPAGEIKSLGHIARRWRDELARVLTEIDAEALALNADQVAALYYLPCGDDRELEYLLRRFKGAYYRNRYPTLSLLGAE